MNLSWLPIWFPVHQEMLTHWFGALQHKLIHQILWCLAKKSHLILEVVLQVPGTPKQFSIILHDLMKLLEKIFVIRKTRQGRKKHHSTILTSKPLKENLIEKKIKLRKEEVKKKKRDGKSKDREKRLKYRKRVLKRQMPSFTRSKRNFSIRYWHWRLMRGR